MRRPASGPGFDHQRSIAVNGISVRLGGPMTRSSARSIGAGPGSPEKTRTVVPYAASPGHDSPGAPVFYVAATPTETQGMSYAPPRSKGPAIAANVALIAAFSFLGSAAARAARGPPMAVCISQ